jgi:hypothetical protein
LFTAAKVGVAVVSAIVVLSLISPLATFILELSENPSKYIYVEGAVKLLNETHIELMISLTYSGRVPLRDFTIAFNGMEVVFGDVTMGDYTKTVVLSIGELSSGLLRITEVSYKIAGLYRVRVRVG